MPELHPHSRHERGDFWVLLAQLVSHQSPLLVTFGTVVLGEDRTQQCCHHGAQALADMGHGVAHEVDAAALPGSMEDLEHSGLEAFEAVSDNPQAKLSAVIN